jgi:hypothetical protein
MSLSLICVFSLRTRAPFEKKKNASKNRLLSSRALLFLLRWNTFTSRTNDDKRNWFRILKTFPPEKQVETAHAREREKHIRKRDTPLPPAAAAHKSVAYSDMRVEEGTNPGAAAAAVANTNTKNTNYALNLDEIVKRDGYLERVEVLDDEKTKTKARRVLKCSITGHAFTLPSEEEKEEDEVASVINVLESFLNGKKRKRLREKKEEEAKLTEEYAPALVQSKHLPEKFFCRVTGKYVPKIEKLVVEHCSGKRFTVGEAKVVGKKQTLLEEGDPREEEEAKEKRKEENRRMAEKLREMRLKEWEERQARRKIAMQEEGEESMEEEEEEEESEEEEIEEAPREKKRAKR